MEGEGEAGAGAGAGYNVGRGKFMGGKTRDRGGTLWHIRI